jgi:hypothetical protein
VGTYHWVATYSGDANNTTVSSACADEPVTIGQATPTIATTPSAGGPIGTSITDTATVSGGVNPTGDVTFSLFPPGNTDCAAPPVFTSTNPLSGGSATSDSFTTVGVGTYHWVATYDGDTNNITASSGCQAEPVTIAGAPQPVVTKAVTSNTQNTNGTWTIIYDVAVTNPDASIETSFTLNDALAFGHHIDVNLAKVTGPGARATWNGTTDTTIVAGAPLGPGATEHYTVTVNGSVLADATASDRTCAAGGGFHNTAQVALPMAPNAQAALTALAASAAADPQASACADPVSPTVTKKVLSVVAGSTAGQWIVTYQVVAANGTGTEVSYSLQDQLGFPTGVTVTSTSASRVHSALDGSGATAAEPIPGWTGTGSGAALASNQMLPVQSKDTFTIVVGATVTASLAAAATGCNATGPAHGYFNSAVLTSGSDQFSAQACAPITPLPVLTSSPPSSPPSPNSSGPLAITGLALSHELLFGAALFGMGAALVLVSRRRRQPRGR